MIFFNYFVVNLIIISCWLKSITAYLPPSPYNSDNIDAGAGALTKIPIGIISDQNTELLSQTFDFAITEANADLSIPIYGLKEEINYGNTIDGYKKLCDLMEAGVGAIFGPTAKQTSEHLMNICDAKDIPYIYPHMSENLDGFNLHPSPLDIAKALYALINEFEWTNFVFLYESSNYLSILNGLTSFYLEGGPIISVLRYDLNLNGNYKAVLRRVRKSENNQVVVVGSKESVAELLKQALQVGIINEYYTYIIGNLDLQTFELEDYKYSEVNITGFRMFSSDQSLVRNLMTEIGYEEGLQNGSCPITLEMALTYDAVQVFAETTKHILYHPQSLNCSDRNDNVQDGGSTFRNYMSSFEIDHKTMTGQIFFEGNVRKGYTLDIIELQTDGLVKIGTWNELKNLTIQRPIKIAFDPDMYESSLANKTFLVLISVPNPPYASLVTNPKRLDGNAQYEGYAVDLIHELADKLGFFYELKNGGKDYGSFNKTTNLTNGMIREIVEGRADLAITDLTITSEREQAVDFSIPFMNLGIAILYRKPTKQVPELFSFMDPFSGDVWLFLGLAYAGVSLCFFILGRLSPTEWDNPYPCIEEPDYLENQFTISNSLWFTTGAVLQQGSEIAPKALSTRTLAAIWWFFTLIIVSSYTANLAAFLTVESPVSVINNIDDLVENKDDVEYGCRSTGSTRTFFATSEEPRYQKMNEYISKNPHLLFAENEKGVEFVNKSQKYAFLMESTTIEYYTERKCELQKVGEPLDEKGYGIAMIKNWPHRDEFNKALLELQEQGVLAKIKNKWWQEIGAGVCNKKGDSGDASALGLGNLGGVYLVLGVGSAISLVYGIVSWCWHTYRKAKHFEVSFKVAFVEEVKFVANFTNLERVLKSAASVYSHSINSSQSIESIETDSDTSVDN